MVNQFIITLMNMSGIRTERINCANETIAKYICEGRFPNMRILEIKESR